jgi:hypothetical protein
VFSLNRPVFPPIFQLGNSAMKVFTLFEPPGNYGPAYPEHAEQFPSLEAAGYALRDRVSGREYSFPCVDSDARLSVFFSDPRLSEDGDIYPDRIITIGPRGGIRVERA